MSVSEHLRRTVALITAPGASSDEPTRPIGSGFFVSVLESHLEPPYLTRRHEYLVTAGHLVRGEERTFVRLRRPENARREGSQGVEEVGIGRWYWPEDQTHDVAAAPLGFSVGDFDHTTIHLDPYRTDPDPSLDVVSEASRFGDPSPIGLGDPVHVISLVSGAPWTGPGGIPVVRSASVAAAWQSASLAGSASGTGRVSGHLVEAVGVAGSGGAPCFRFGDAPPEELPYLIQEARKLGDETLWQKALERHQETKFFGMIAGPLAREAGRGLEDGASGMGIVVPREHVMGLIHSTSFREQREEHMRRAVEEERRLEDPDAPAPVPDTSGRPRRRSRRWR